MHLRQQSVANELESQYPGSGRHNGAVESEEQDQQQANDCIQDANVYNGNGH